MADLSDVRQILGDLDEYQRNQEANRNLLSKQYTTTTPNKKMYKYLDASGAEVGFFGTANEFDVFVDEQFGGKVPVKAAPEEKPTVLKDFTYTDSETGATHNFQYSEKALDNWLKGQGLNASPVNINEYFKLQAEGLGIVGSYDIENIDATKQRLFNFRSIMNEGTGVETKPISTKEAQFAIDINNILDDYENYTEDDFILGDENNKARLREIRAIYESYLADIQNNAVTASRINYLKKKMDKTEERWTQAKADKMSKSTRDGQVFVGVDKRVEEEEFNPMQYVKDTYGADSVMYFNPTTKEYKISTPLANTVPGSGVEGYTPLGKISSDSSEDFYAQIAVMRDDPAAYTFDKKLDERDEKTLNEYLNTKKWFRDKGLVTVTSPSGDEVDVHMGVLVNLVSEEAFDNFMVQIGYSGQGKIRNLEQFFKSGNAQSLLDRMINIELFANQHKAWGWYTNPEAEIPAEYKKKYKPKAIPAAEYVSPFTFDPKLKDSQVDPNNRLGINLDMTDTTPPPARTFGTSEDNTIDVDGIMYKIPPQFRNLNTDPQVKAMFERIIRSNPELAKTFRMGQSG
tara:strand:+ start:2574 stop:4289 length:1716 start_codon:yes stop_codon:yes gene_type:complete